MVGTNLEVYASVQRWMTRLEKKSKSGDFSKSQTKRAFLFWLGKYCMFLTTYNNPNSKDKPKTNPDSLIMEREQQVQDNSPMIKRRHEDYVESFVVKLKNDGYAPNSVSMAQGAISSFYSANHLGLIELDTVRAHNIRTFKVPQVSELKKMCILADKEGDLVIEAWILCQSNSGLSITDLLTLNWNQQSSEFGTIRHQIEKGITPIHIEIRRQKTGERTDSFFGPNAIEALKKYTLSNGGSMNGRIFKISVRSIQAKVKNLAIRAKVTTDSFPITPHKLRDYFDTYMTLAGVNHELVKRMMGHSLGKVRGTYLTLGSNKQMEGIPISKLAEIYMKAYPTIDITQV